jgi:hypothetical protein
VFAGLPLDAVNSFKDLFLLRTPSGDRFVSEDDRDAMWDYFESLVRISIHYLQEHPQKNIWNIDVEKTKSKWKN